MDSYVYDIYGNMRNISRQNLGVGVEESYSFTYDNSNWKDQLIGVNYTSTGGVTTSRTFTYDAIGNPLTYYNGKKNWSFTWKNGKQLAAASDGTNSSILYQYNALKYRGYYHDKDLGMYYLNYRYYDPAICRFINADDLSVLAIEQGIELLRELLCVNIDS